MKELEDGLAPARASGGEALGHAPRRKVRSAGAPPLAAAGAEGAASTFALAAAAEAERRWLIELFTSPGPEPAGVELLVRRRVHRRLRAPRWGERRRFPRG